MSQTILFSFVLCFVVMMSGGYHSDDQYVVTAKDYKNHTIELKGFFRKIFIFSKKTQRTRFLKLSVILEILGYLYFLTGIVLSFVLNENSFNFDLCIYLMGIPAFVTLVFGGYYKIQSYKFKRNLPKNKDKTFWEYMHIKNK